MVDRPRHPKKEIERFMRIAESHGWRFVKGEEVLQGILRLRYPPAHGPPHTLEFALPRQPRTPNDPPRLLVTGGHDDELLPATRVRSTRR